MRGLVGRAAAVTIAAGAAVVAQDVGSIRGTVADREWKGPLAEVQVSVVETGQRAVSDVLGVFTFAALRPGKYTLVFAKDGYVREVRADLVVAAGKVTDLEVTLAGDITELEPRVVTDVVKMGAEGDATSLDTRLESPALVDSIGSEVMSKAGASDAAAALRLVAGASLQNGKTAVIRGLPDRYVSSQINGVRMPSADEDKRAVELDQFPAEVIAGIQVAKTFTPDQFGDASGGAVNVLLKGVPDEPFLARWKLQTSHNTQTTGRHDFLTYRGGGLQYWGGSASSRGEQELGENWDGAVGVTEGDAPLDYKWSGSIGGRVEVARGVRVGGTVNIFYERDSSLERNGIDDSWRVNTLGEPVVPETSGSPTTGEFRTALLDIRQGKQSVQWGGLVTAGVETDQHALTLAYLWTRSAEDTATIADDTRGKQYFFPGYDPDVPTTPGHDNPDGAPYLRYQTLDYTLRTTSTLQLAGRHRIPQSVARRKSAIEVDWTLAHSTADRDQPDKRLLATSWTPDLFVQLRPVAVFTLGNLQRTYKTLAEESDQYTLGVKVPFAQWSGLPGYVKVGVFGDRVRRSYDQDTFSNFADPSGGFAGDFDEVDWSVHWPFEDHAIGEGTTDVDYDGKQDITASYVMFDVPLARSLNLIGGLRQEATKLRVVNFPEELATWLPEGESASASLQPGDADVDFHERNILPSAGLVWRPADTWTLRAAYGETVARQTFKEITPILNQEYLGGPVFVGNPNLRTSHIRNYDLRADWTPTSTTLVSVSWFEKDIRRPIEYLERATTFNFTTAANYPRGNLSGYEIEARQGLAPVAEALDGVTFGGNLTQIEARVNLPDSEIQQFRSLHGRDPSFSRDMTSAPDWLWNLFVTWDVALTKTQIGLFYTVQGDTLVQGSGPSNTTFVPPTYLTRFDTLNLSVAQKLGENVRLVFAAKNITDSEQREVYRSEFIASDVLRRRSSDGIDFSLTLGGEIRF
ncbi:MAG: TonB-dependent receptor [Planctomycetes bacterium]|nr:TonB-dependent receptor [Planctomycetota bacterium]